MILKYILCAVAAYLLGSISTGVLLSRRLFHDDVRKHGSGGARTAPGEGEKRCAAERRAA